MTIRTLKTDYSRAANNMINHLVFEVLNIYWKTCHAIFIQQSRIYEYGIYWQIRQQAGIREYLATQLKKYIYYQSTIWLISWLLQF